MRFFPEEKDSADLKAAIEFLNNVSLHEVEVDISAIAQPFEYFQSAFEEGLPIEKKDDVDYVDPAPWYDDDDGGKFIRHFTVNTPIYNPNDHSLMIEQYGVDPEGDWEPIFSSHHVYLDQPIVPQIEAWGVHSQSEAKLYLQLQDVDYHLDWARYYLSCICNKEMVEIIGDWEDREIFDAKSCEMSVLRNLNATGLFQLNKVV